MIRPFRDLTPAIHDSAWVAPDAWVLGDVALGAESSVWFGCVVRGDVFPIRIGARTNIQDSCVLHVTHDRYATVLEDDVTVGHRVVLHGCHIGAGSLVGIGAVVLDNVDVGAGCLVGAGALVTPGTKIPAGMVALGSPAKVVREVTDAERAWMAESASNYVGYAREYRRSLGAGF